jgi:deazaflavin-dependent oxidoreductase (nitroreductase family)
MTHPDDAAAYNTDIVRQFRANRGRVGGVWNGIPLLVLHHTGARTGTRRVTPVGYLPHEGRYVVFASNGGASRHPDWYHNLKAHPSTQVEVGADTIDVLAEDATGAERDLLLGLGTARFPSLAAHATRTERAFPVVILTPDRA